MTSKRTLRLLTSGFLLMLFALTSTVALAAPPTTASGTYVYTDSYFESFRTAGGNAIIDVVATVEYTGTFTGTSVVRGTIVVHADGGAVTIEVGAHRLPVARVFAVL